MTHCLQLVLKLNNYEDVKELRNPILKPDGQSGLVFYSLHQTEFTIEPKNRLCPFIYFPEDEHDQEEDGSYLVFFDTGSHCAWYDTVEALYCWTHWFIVITELEALMIDHKYWISADGEDEHLTIKQAFKRIVQAGDVYNRK